MTSSGRTGHSGMADDGDRMDVLRPLLGEWRIQIKKAADADFRSLEPEDIRNAYLVLGFKTS